MAPLIAGAPDEPAPLPAELAPLVGSDRADCVWRNEVGGLTFAVAAGEGPARYLKWAPAGAPLDFVAEAARLRWAARWAAVPAVLDVDPGGRWLVTAAVPGRSAVDPRWLGEPVTAARAIGQGLRMLHDALPVEGCPFDWSAGRRIREAERAGRPLPAGVRRPPPVDRLVVAHADACAPNTLLDDAGRFLAHVDLGRLGVADRWADLAIATYSLAWNYVAGTDATRNAAWRPREGEDDVAPEGVNLEAELLDAYGVERDDDRIHYYRALWDAT